MPKVLVVEDDSLIVRLYQKVFTFEGYEFVSANGGEEGLIKAESEKPDVILLDIMMPKMDGLVVLEKLKANQNTKNIPVVILTNLIDDSVCTKALSMGASGYLVKSELPNHQIVEEVKRFLPAAQ